MTFRKTKLIDNRPSWHRLRLRDKFGSQGDHIRLVPRTCFSPQSRRGGSFDLVLAKRILRAEDNSHRVFSSCGRKMKALDKLYSFVQSTLFSSPFLGPSLACSREACFARPNRRACSQTTSSIQNKTVNNFKKSWTVSIRV